MVEIFEGRWRCTSCTVENKGRVERCDGCGVARPAGVQFYLPGNEPAVADAALLADAYSGRDWYCDHCNGANKASVDGMPVTHCINCGQARDAGDATHVVTGEEPVRVARLTTDDRGAGLRRMIGAGQGKAHQADRNDSCDLSRRSEHAAQGHQMATWGLMILGIVATITILVLLLRTHEVQAEVTGKSWMRSISIAQVETLRRDGWSVPADARQISSERRPRGSREVVDHYRTVTENVAVPVPQTETYGCGTRDMGNGYFEAQTCSRTTYTTRYESQTRQEPVYRTEAVFDTWYVYDEDVWSTARRCRAAGLVDAPFWQDCPYTAPGEREAGRSEVYTITLAFDETTAPLKIDQVDWNGILIGQTLQIDVSRGGTPKSLAKPD